MGVWLRDLPAALDGWGLKVITEPGWQIRGHGPLLRSPRGILNHWTATPFRSMDNPLPTRAVVTRGRADLAGPLDNLLVGFDGSVCVTAAGLAYHAGTGNRGVPLSGNPDTIGIEIEGDGHWTPEQLWAVPRINAALWHWYADVTLARIIAHFEWTTRKIDINTWPGGMSALRAAIRAATRDEDWLTMDVHNPYANNGAGGTEPADVALGYAEQRIRNGVVHDLTHSDEFLNTLAERVAAAVIAKEKTQ